MHLKDHSKYALYLPVGNDTFFYNAYIFSMHHEVQKVINQNQFMFCEGKLKRTKISIKATKLHAIFTAPSTVGSI